MAKAIGAPSQPSQPSRKGKRAWRKNVDIGEIEERLEGLRDEERLTGSGNTVSSYCRRPQLITVLSARNFTRKATKIYF